jgi:CTP:molybdopterin cytidylyltransferase MocA
LLEAVVGLYAATGWPRAIVTTSALAALYRPLLEPREVAWIERPRGAGTAASVVAAIEDLAGRATHLWLHPVDLPELRPETLALLHRRSREEPDATLVPVCAGTPGHPVVLPVARWLGLRGTRPQGPMRELLRAGMAGAPPLEIPVDDPGIAADRDTPGDLRGSVGDDDG